MSAKPIDVRFEPNERAPVGMTVGLGAQMALLSIGGIVFTPAIIIRASSVDSPEFLAWAVFGAVLVSGITTILQSLGYMRIGAGYILLMGTSGAFIGVCIAALNEGGPAVMATLVVISALFQLLFSAKLSKFRSVLTPTVAGTVIMLIAVTVMPILFGMLDDVPAEAAEGPGAGLSALATILLTLILALKAQGYLRLWAPAIGVAAGTVVGAAYGLFDTQAIQDAAWFGIPAVSGHPGLDLSFGSAFWVMLPAFIFVTMIGAIETVGDSIAIQRVSWRKSRAVDFRTVQGALNADGVGNFMSGLVGTIPNTTYSSSVAMVELTGVAARTVGVALGCCFLVLAFFPKFLALILAIPGPVVAAFVTVLIAMLFVVGMKIVVQDGITYRKGLVCGIAFWIGTGLQGGVIFPETIESLAGGTFANGMVGGGLIAMILTAFMSFTGSRRRSLQTKLDMASLPEVQAYVRNLASTKHWDEGLLVRVEGAIEEAMIVLTDDESDTSLAHMMLSLRPERHEIIVELIASSEADNIEDRIALLSQQATQHAFEQQLSLHLLRHLTTSVRHERYHGTAIMTLSVAKTTD